MEIREIPSAPGYAATSQGHIVSLARTVSRGQGTMKIRERVLSESANHDGRLQVSISNSGKTRSRMIHRLVAEAWYGSRPQGLEIRHLNGKVQDNRPRNLKYGTHSENMQDTIVHGTNVNASKTACPSGHPYSEFGRYREKYNDRVCRKCRYVAERKRLGRLRRK